jgi:hypothetical protein
MLISSKPGHRVVPLGAATQMSPVIAAGKVSSCIGAAAAYGACSRNRRALVCPDEAGNT